jgi:uncharacterized protein (TIGR03067 family)
MTRTSISVSCIAVLVVFGEAGRLNRLCATEEKANLAQSDAERVRGHWVASRQWEDGKASGAPAAAHVVFTDKEFKLPGLSWEYQLDPKTTPKQLNLQHVAGMNMPAIYAFDGEKLWLCILMSTRGERPKDFDSKPGDHRLVLLLERGKPNPDGRPLLVAPGFKLADEKLRGELRATISRWAESIEKGRYAEFIKGSLAPDELGEMLKRENKTVEELASQPASKQRVAAMAKLLRATEKKIPAANEAGTWAYFDLRDIHSNGAPPRPVMLFRKVDGTWHLTEKEPELPRK